MLKEYYEITAQIEALSKKKEELREKLIKKGTHASRDFICEVKEQCRRSVSLVEIEKRAMDIAIELSNANLIKETTSTIVKVTPKGA